LNTFKRKAFTDANKNSEARIVNTSKVSLPAFRMRPQNPVTLVVTFLVAFEQETIGPSCTINKI
jgi:hypothetical protein